MAGLQAVSTESEIVGRGRVSGVWWQLWEEAVEVTSGLNQNVLASSVREKFWKWMAAQENRVGCISPCPFFFTSSVMQLVYGGQLTGNYLLNGEVNTQELVHGMGGEGGKPDTQRKNAPMPSVTDPENVTGIGCEALRFSSSHENSPWWEFLDVADSLIASWRQLWVTFTSQLIHLFTHN